MLCSQMQRRMAIASDDVCLGRKERRDHNKFVGRKAKAGVSWLACWALVCWILLAVP